MPPSWHPVPACTPRLRCRRAILYRHDDCAASIPKSRPEIKNHCTLEGINRQNHAAIPKFTPEIKNRCTQEGVNGEKHASIRKSGHEIKNRCTQEGLNGENRAGHPPARVYKRGSAGGKSEVFCVKVGSTVAAKRVLMSPEAAFPYVFAAEGAQHPPKKTPRSTTIAAATAKKKTPRNQPKPPQNPPGHSSYTMRGGQTVTPY